MVAPMPPQPQNEKSSLVPIVKETIVHWMEDNAMRLSAALSLYTILSLAPLLVITIKIIGLVWKSKEAARQLIIHQMSSLMGSQATQAIRPMLDNSSQHGSGILAATISIIVLLLSATGVFGELQGDMNTIWGVKPKPNQGPASYFRHRLLSIAMVLGIASLLLVSIFVSTILASSAKYLAEAAKCTSFLADVVVSYFVIAAMFAAFYKFLPDAKVAWRDVWAGALLASGLFIVGKYVLTVYFTFATPTSAFGAAGSLAAVLIWVYYSAFILFFGAEFTKVWAFRHGHRIIPSQHAEMAMPEKRTPEQVHAQMQSLQTARAESHFN